MSVKTVWSHKIKSDFEGHSKVVLARVPSMGEIWSNRSV